MADAILILHAIMLFIGGGGAIASIFLVVDGTASEKTYQVLYGFLLLFACVFLITTGALTNSFVGSYNKLKKEKTEQVDKKAIETKGYNSGYKKGLIDGKAQVYKEIFGQTPDSLQIKTEK
jgi:hypothetical protein